MRAIAVLAVLVALGGCAPPRPIDVVTGEACWRCRQPIKHAKLAGEMIASNGLALKFRTVHCMSTWIAQQKSGPEDTFFVTDYSSGKWIRASGASYVRMIVDRDTMARDFVAFKNGETAAITAQAEKTVIQNWENVLAAGRTEPLGGN
jgi:hypothetical protein